MSGKYIRSSVPFFPKEDIERLVLDIATALDEGKLRNGKNLHEFERVFAEYIGVRDAIAFDSEGDALETVLQYYGVKDREVVVCTNSFISIPNSVVYAGGRVIFADIRDDTLSMDPNSLSRSISKNTCGVIVTHIAGFPNPDLKKIMEICQENSLFLIEDAGHAVGATVNGRKVGTFGDSAVFDFTPTKVLTTGEGGMLATNDAKLGEEARRFRYYSSGPGKTNFVNLGRYMMLPEISAILGIYQLRRIEEFVAKRNHIARIYNDELSRIDSVRIIKYPPDNRCSYYKYPLTLNDNIDRVKFTELLDKEYGIETGTIFYPPCHLQTFYQKLHTRNHGGNLLTAERVLSKTITLPIHAAISDEDAKSVVHGIHSVLALATVER